MERNAVSARDALIFLEKSFPEDGSDKEMKMLLKRASEECATIVQRCREEEHAALSKVTNPCLCKTCRAARAVEEQSRATTVSTSGSPPPRRLNPCQRFLLWMAGY